MKKQSGFTLIELMIVMAVIAILATAGISAYTGYVKKGRDTARAEIAQNLNTAVMSYAASNGGNPPATPTAFEQFLASSSEVFGGSGFDLSAGTLIEDPVGGKDVCMNANKEPNQPCRFDYTAYSDGTYAISYGVESESSMEENFYKTTKSIADPADTRTTPETPIDKYGVYVGSAPFIGSTLPTSNTTPTKGADEEYVPIGSTDPITMALPLFLTKRIDAPTSSSGGVIVTCSPECASGFVCSPVSSTCKKICGSGTIRARDDRCWYTSNLGGDGAFYQWGRSDTTFTQVTTYPWDWSSPQDPNLWTDTGGINNPCPLGSHVPSSIEWQALINAEAAAGVTDLTNSTLQLPKAGTLDGSNGSLYDSGTDGYYWSSSPSGSNASNLYFNSGIADVGISDRAYGSSVRCIQDL